MKRFTRRPSLPKRFWPKLPLGLIRAEGIFYVRQKKPGPWDQISLKILVCKNRLNMRRVYRHFFQVPQWDHGGLSKYTQGSCIEPTCDGIRFHAKGETEVRYEDPRYFAIMLLNETDLNLEVISHECVHAAHYFDRRFPQCEWPGKDCLPEEGICYPQGQMVGALMEWLEKEGFKVQLRSAKKKKLAPAKMRCKNQSRSS